MARRLVQGLCKDNVWHEGLCKVCDRIMCGTKACARFVQG